MDIETIDQEINQVQNEMTILMSKYSELEKKIEILNKVKFHKERELENRKATKNNLSKDERIKVFMSLFRGRKDVFAVRYESVKTGKSGYQPCCKNKWKYGICEKQKIKCSDCLNRELVPLSEKIIESHLTGEKVIGIYPLLENENCYFLAADFDKTGWVEDVTAFKTTCENMDIPCYIERSRSGNGAHVWIFFSEEVKARKARNLGTYILTETMNKRPELGFDSYDRLFPNQDTMPQGGFGNLIALPLQKKARQNGNSVFLNNDMQPVENQWEILSNIKKIDNEYIDKILTKAQDNGGLLNIRTITVDEVEVKPWEVPPSGIIKQVFTKSELPEKLKIVLGNQIYIEKDDISPKLKNLIIRLAAFQNPEFYKAQAMRLSTYDKPRIINCGEISEKYIFIPRGCFDELAQEMKKLGVKMEIEDKRFYGYTIEAEFKGELFEEQKKAAEKLLEHEMGVLSATTAFGKTVLATYMISQRKVNTLILVHRKQLLEQWVERLSTFLGIDKKEIGTLCGGKRKLTNKIDVALIQSLGQKGTVDDMVANYGYIIVDECHHISASSFEMVIRQSRAKYLTGLSATVIRKDGHHPIIFMNLGPVRYNVDARKQAELRAFEHHVYVRNLETQIIREDENEPFGITSIYAQLAKNERRNAIIVEDIIKNVKEGRFPLVLTERKSHIDILAQMLSQNVKNVFVLSGNTKNKERIEILEKLDSISDNEEKVLITTGKYLGEGFDNKKLDTLFLTLPISWSGTLSQYAGRLHRSYFKKQEVKIYDYVDTNIPMIEKMHQKRLKGYKAIGYEIR